MFKKLLFFSFLTFCFGLCAQTITAQDETTELIQAINFINRKEHLKVIQKIDDYLNNKSTKDVQEFYALIKIIHNIDYEHRPTIKKEILDSIKNHPLHHELAPIIEALVDSPYHVTFALNKEWKLESTYFGFGSEKAIQQLCKDIAKRVLLYAQHHTLSDELEPIITALWDNDWQLNILEGVLNNKSPESNNIGHLFLERALKEYELIGKCYRTDCVELLINAGIGIQKWSDFALKDPLNINYGVTRCLLNNPQFNKQLQTYITNNFGILCTQPDFFNFLIPLLHENTIYKQLFINLFHHHFKQLALSDFRRLFCFIEKDTSPTFLQELLQERPKNFEQQLKLIMYANSCQDGKNIYAQYFSVCPTEIHLLHHLSHCNRDLTIFIQNHNTLHITERIIQLQKELDTQGYYTFVHGQRWNYRIIERWFTWLWLLKHHIEANNYTFAHVKKTKANLVNEQNHRIDILKNGRTSNKARARLLFMNYALFANATNVGSSTAHYFLNNTNVHPSWTNFEKSFSLHDPAWQTIYEQYKQELSDLEQEHQQLTKHGNLFLIAIPKNIIQDCVYCAIPGGYKTKIMIDGIGETDDIRLIMETLLHNPEKISNTDYIEFCLVMTWDITLNPASGIKFFDFNDVDSDKLEAFNKKEQALFQKVKQTIIANKLV